MQLSGLTRFAGAAVVDRQTLRWFDEVYKHATLASLSSAPYLCYNGENATMSVVPMTLETWQRGGLISGGVVQVFLFGQQRCWYGLLLCHDENDENRRQRAE
ncbi:hypothetical protein PIB30_052378 [Stylosanthes scabra]|uniref:Uncharacterized protein n=1 Tax=Stylosanthes scabra TaxID=79078 RepID=A0ABU6VL92_9FABA|nr:hypothetical protein [Stylosanthes scabra]